MDYRPQQPRQHNTPNYLNQSNQPNYATQPDQSNQTLHTLPQGPTTYAYPHPAQLRNPPQARQQTYTARFQVPASAHPHPPRPPQSHREQALEGFYQFGEMLNTSDYFDSRDCHVWTVQAEALTRTNGLLDTLRDMVPKRRQLIEAWDDKYKLSMYFPEMMREFVRRDAALNRKLEIEEEKERRQREHLNFHQGGVERQQREQANFFRPAATRPFVSGEGGGGDDVLPGVPPPSSDLPPPPPPPPPPAETPK